MSTSLNKALDSGVGDDPEFRHAIILIPKRGAEGDNDKLTFSPAAQVRTAASLPEGAAIQLDRPRRSVADELPSLGFTSLRKLQVAPDSARGRRGSFAHFDQLGTAAVFARKKADLEDAMEKLSNDYDVFNDFPLSLPQRVIDPDYRSERSLSYPPRREWPDESGIPEAHAQNIRGAGVLFGLLDTGVDADHLEFINKLICFRYVSLQPNSVFLPPRDVRGFDTGGHGTHVCGIAAGDNIGVAPEAKLYVASVIESESNITSMSRVLAGLDWLFRQFTRPDNEHLPAVVNLSLGFVEQPNIPEIALRLRLLERLIRTMLQANILLVASLGNEGPQSWRFPGAFKDVLGVGAIDFRHGVAPFSCWGAPNGTAKPDVVGYGVEVNSAIERDYSGKSVYRRLSGTSMAAPYVAGIAALYRSVYPDLTVAAIRSRIIEEALALPVQELSVGAGLARIKLPTLHTTPARRSPQKKGKGARDAKS